MGGDKALMLLDGQPLIQWVADRFAPQVEALALSANGDSARFDAMNLPVLADESPLPLSHDSTIHAAKRDDASSGTTGGQTSTRDASAGLFSASRTSPFPRPQSQGPLSGVLAGLRWAAPLGATALVCVPCDGPFLPPDLVPRLCLAAEGNRPALAQSDDDLHPTYGLWPVTLLPALEAFLASDAVPRLRDFAFAQDAAIAHFPSGSFANANTPEDLAALEARLVDR